MLQDENIPFAFEADHWVRSPPDRANLSQDDVWCYLQADATTLRQANRGWSFKEEGYVRNVMWNSSGNSDMCLVRGIVLPSMKKGQYTVSAWFSLKSGFVEGATCECIAGKSGRCQHVAALLLQAEESCTKNKPSCTDVRCAWIVPSEAKKPAAPMPLSDITFRKFLMNKPGTTKRKRSFNPCELVPPASPMTKKEMREKMLHRSPSVLWLRHGGGACQPVPPKPPLPIEDSEDLWSTGALEVVRSHIQAVPLLSSEERVKITAETVGQASNSRWHQERVGRITASQFAAAIRCRKPEYLVKRILYPKQGAGSEAMQYGRDHEADAVNSYLEHQELADNKVEVRETGLHLHPKYNYIGASPDRIVTINGDEGLLEVKCPMSQKGKTVEEAARLKSFCCERVQKEVRLKRNHPYFFQVQGQMAVTGHKWCHFVIWTEEKDGEERKGSTHVETIDFDEKFFNEEMLPGLLYFAEHALFPEMLTRRLRRQGVLHRRYVSYKEWCCGFYSVEDMGDLKMCFRRLK